MNMTLFLLNEIVSHDINCFFFSCVNFTEWFVIYATISLQMVTEHNKLN